MALAERADEIVRGLPRDWERARIELTLDEPADADRAALVLAPASPGRSGSTFITPCHERLGGRRPSPGSSVACSHGSTRRGSADASGSWRRSAGSGARRPGARRRGTGDARGLVGRSAAPPAVRLERLATPRWSSTRATTSTAARCSSRRSTRPAPAARAFVSARASDKGYGVAPVMARRAFERLDGEGITGRIRILRVLSDTSLPHSQGPVWREDGRAV